MTKFYILQEQSDIYKQKANGTLFSTLSAEGIQIRQSLAFAISGQGAGREFKAEF